MTSGFCPLSWPMPAGCTCNCRWHLGPAPTVFPPEISSCSCCYAKGEGGAVDGGTASDAWIQRLHAGCMCASSGGGGPIAESTTRAEHDEVAAGRAASLSRLQHHHMKYVRRVLHALRGQGQRGGPQGKKAAKRQRVADDAEQPSASSAATGCSVQQQPAFETSLYIGGMDGACDRCMLMRLCGSAMPTCMAVCDALRDALPQAGLRLEHAHVDTGATMAQTSSSSALPSSELTRDTKRVVPLPIEGAAPHGATRLQLAVSDAGRVATSLLGMVTRLRAQHSLCVCAMDISLLDGDASSAPTAIRASVSVALRARAASGAAHETAQEARAVDVAEKWCSDVTKSCEGQFNI